MTERSESESTGSLVAALAVDEEDVAVAVLDRSGVIIAVNEAWQRFSRSNSGDPERTGVGVDYLKACDQAGNDPGAAGIAAAIRAALQGQLGRASVVEIPCHSPITDRWFNVLVSERTNEAGAAIGATVILMPVTGRAQNRHIAAQERNVAELVLLDALAVLQSTVATASSISEVYDAIAQGARVVARADASVVNLLDDSGDVFVTVAGSGLFEDRLVGHRMPADGCVSGTVFASGTTEIVADARVDKRVWQPAVAGAEVGPAMCVPIGAGSLAGGVVGVHRTRGGEPFGPDDAVAVEKFTAQAALTVQAAERLLDPDPAPLLPAVATEVEANDVVGGLWPLNELSEARMWSTIESAPDAMVMTDEHGVILMVNRQVETMFGYDRGDLLGRTVETLLPDRHRQIHSAHRTRYRVQPTIRVMGAGLDLWARRADGTEFPVEISLSPVADDDGTAVIASIRDITQRVAAEAQSQLIQTTIDAAHDGVFMFRADTLEFTYVNQGAIDQVGYSRDEFLSMTPVHIKPEYTVASFRQTIAPLIAGEIERHTFRTIHRGKDGSDVPVEIILEYPEAAHPAADRVLVALVRDITERLEAEQQLQDSETRFRAAFDEGPVPMGIVSVGPDTERTVLAGNQALADLLGYDRDQLAGLTYSQLIHPDDLDIDDARIARTQAGQRSDDEAIKRYLRADGTPVWVRLHSAPLSKEGDQVTAIGHLIDISAEVEADSARSRQESLNQALSDLRLKMLQGASRAEGLTLICESAAQTLAASSALILTPTGGGDDLKIETAVNLPKGARAALRFSKDAGVVGDVFSTGEPRFTKPGDPQATSGNRAVMVDLRVGSVVIAPLHGVDEVAGVLLVVRDADADTQFDEGDLAGINRFASEAVIAIELAAYRDNQQRIELLQDRERIAQDLHDKVIQRLFAAGMGLQAVVGQVEPAAAAERVAKTVTDLDGTIVEIRSSIFALSALDTPKTIAEQLRETIAMAAEALGHQPDINLPEDIESIPLAVVEQLLPTITEALSNVARHANATHTTITLTLESGGLVLGVGDNGSGIDDSRAGGRGLDNMIGRARRLGGSCQITNNPTAGATLTWHVPI